MISNYLKIALRNIIRQKMFSTINIFGLALGIAVCALILLFVEAEMSYDNFHQYKERIYRIHRQWKTPDGSIRWELCSLAPSFVPLLEMDFPEMEHVVRLYKSFQEKLVSVGEKKFIEKRVFFAEADVFEVLGESFLKGESNTALSQPNSVVLTQSTAYKYFGNENPIGKSMQLDGNQILNVTGVIKDVPSNSHLHYDILISYLSLKGKSQINGDDYFLGSKNFSDNVCLTYVRLAEQNKIETIEAKLPEFLDRHFPAQETESSNIVKASQRMSLKLMKVTDIHLYSHSTNEFEQNSDVNYIYIFTSIALFVLLIACINFMNLSTARSIRRAKEVGLRKVIGAHRGLLVYQFMGESIITAFIATIFACIIVELAVPYFNSFTGLYFELSVLSNPLHVIILGGVFLFSGTVAGLYPAIFVSSYQPAPILRGELTRGKEGHLTRKSLVVFQFAISICLIVCVGLIYKQMRFIQNADLGFDKNNVILIPADRTIRNRWKEVRQNLIKHPHILNATASKRAPGGRLLDSPGYRTEVYGKVNQGEFFLPHHRADLHFLNTYQMEIIAGRDFSAEHLTDSLEAYLLNETAVSKLGWKKPEDAVGAPLQQQGRSGKIIGVVRDFNYESLHSSIHPMLFYFSPSWNTISIRIDGKNLDETIEYVREVWDKFHPGYPVDYTFLDERLDKLYQNERRMMQLFLYFCGLAIIIACLGLFGLSSFMVQQRTKEIGVRKVLGASVGVITRLLSTEMLKWVIIANIFAWPIAWYSMNKWLQNFAYRTEISFWIFLISSFVALLIALATVGLQTFKAAMSNPVDTLRYE